MLSETLIISGHLRIPIGSPSKQPQQLDPDKSSLSNQSRQIGPDKKTSDTVEGHFFGADLLWPNCCGRFVLVHDNESPFQCVSVVI